MILLPNRVKITRIVFTKLIFAAVLGSSAATAVQTPSAQDPSVEAIPLCITDSVPTFEVAFSPKQGARDLVISTINNAKKSIYVAAYSFTSTAIADALEDAEKRGLDVKILIDKKRINEQGSVYLPLKSKNISIRANSKYKIMHDKFMIIDGDTIQTGSFNYTKAADKSNAENVLVIHNSINLATKYLNEWQKLWDEAEK